MRLTAYFDDSGHAANKKVLLVCGFVTSEERWNLFEKEWAAILRQPRFDLDYLHMKEFSNYRGRFEKFKDNLLLQRALFSTLYELLDLRTEATFGCTVLLQDYDRINADHGLEETYGHPLAIAGCASINRALRWMEKHHPGDRIRFVFDRGMDGWGNLLRLAQRFWIDEVIPVTGSYKEQLALQAADHVAWELHRFATKAVDAGFAPKSVRTRGSLDSLMARFQKEDTWLLVNELELRNMCESRLEPGPVPRRRV